MKIKCYSVRVRILERVSEKAFKVGTFDGATDIIPSSQIFGWDEEVQKSDAVWISAWILEKKSLQYSSKKAAWFDSITGQMQPTYMKIVHNAEKKEPIGSNEIESLKKSE